MRPLALLSCLLLFLALPGCMTAPGSARNRPAPAPLAAASPLLEKPFALNVMQYLYRWHFDESYVLSAHGLDVIEIWARPLHPRLDQDDRSEFAEMWIPAVNLQVLLKRSDYRVPELDLVIKDDTFKIQRVARQPRPPAARPNYLVGRYDLAEVEDFLFAARTNRVLLGDNLRLVGRKLIADYLAREHPGPFTTDQILYAAPVSPVCNDVWVLWETERKLLLFSGDMDLANPGFSELSQLRMHVIDLDKDVVASAREVPGSNAFVTKDWVGRMFFNCILHGERLVRTPEEISRLRSGSAPSPK